MKLTNYLDISRFWLLMKVELFRSRRGILMTFVVTFGALFILGFLLDIAVDQNKLVYEHHENYASSLLIGGFILSSLAFNDLSTTLRRHHYLTLPVSTLERFISMWLLTSVGWIVLFTLAFTAYTWIANSVGQLLFRNVTFQTFEPLGEFSLDTMQYYFVLQGIFLVGAAHFKGYALPKTLFTLVLAALVVGTSVYFILKDVFLAEHVCTDDGECEFVEVLAYHQVWLSAKWAFWWLLAPLCWVTTYIGLKEKEV